MSEVIKKNFSFNLKPEIKPRQEFERAAMNFFNDKKAYHTHIVDGGEFGFLLMEWDNHWQLTWIQPEKIK